MTIISLIVFFVLGIIILITLRKRYINCPQGKIMVIYGRVDNPNEDGIEIIMGGSKFIYPIIQDYAFIDLSVYKEEYKESLYSKDNVKINLDTKIEYGISNHPDIVKNAAIRLLGKDKEQISAIANDLIHGLIIKWISKKDILDVAINRSNNNYHLINELSTEINKELNKIGISLISINVRGLKDLNGQIKDLENQYNELKMNTTRDPKSDDELNRLNELNAEIEKNAIERNKLLSQKLKLLVGYKK